MATDTAQKRMSGIELLLPWRTPKVDATESGFNAGNRQAAAWHYSGIVSTDPAPPNLPTIYMYLNELHQG